MAGLVLHLWACWHLGLNHPSRALHHNSSAKVTIQTPPAIAMPAALKTRLGPAMGLCPIGPLGMPGGIIRGPGTRSARSNPEAAGICGPAPRSIGLPARLGLS
mmetsp:Transcript_103080/g.204674  ORF Transcript_103080/g.204674 Transcript_103080/m.204674 type:complete len:103 (-) Transcript_103080:1406-1714(-)